MTMEHFEEIIKLMPSCKSPVYDTLSKTCTSTWCLGPVAKKKFKKI